MTIRAAKFTPKVLLSAPRRSEGIPNSDASKVLYSVSTYSFEDHSKKSEIRILDVISQQTSLVTDDKTASEPTWVDDDNILVLKSGDDGVTTVLVGKADNFENDNYSAGTVEGPIGDLKTYRVSDDEIAFAVSGKAKPDGSLYNPEKAEKPQTSGRLYKSMFVRHWDHYVTENRNAIWLGKLTKKDGKFELSNLRNALKGTKLESPIDPFGGKDHFDISKNGLVFTAKDRDLNPALHTRTRIYVSAHAGPGFWKHPDLWSSEASEVRSVDLAKTHGFEGACTSPVWSKSGEMIAFLAMRTDGYESDKNQPFIIHDYNKLWNVTLLYATKDGKGKWDRSPQSISWSPNDWHMYFTAEEHGRGSLFHAGPPKRPGEDSPLPTILVKGGNVADVKVLTTGDLFITSNSLIENSLYSFVPVSDSKNHEITYDLPISENVSESSNSTTRYISSNTRSGSLFGLSRSQISEIHWEGAAKNTSVHAWVVKPSNFSSSKTYPLAYLIHGGPQGAWEDSWSTRWNPAVFAEQGYVVICPNPTGSTSYGQAFTDAIQGQWGGLPYEDLVSGFDWIRKNLSYVDTKRSVALGASYGGYMVNWIQGHPLGRHFKALVTHDGVFSMASQMSSEELYFPFHDLKGAPWKKREEWEKWDPSRHTGHWETPHLVIHSELDYRLLIGEGLAAFHTLQTRGVESQFLTFPDENHWVLKPENSLLWHETVFNFINPKVGLEPLTEDRNGDE